MARKSLREIIRGLFGGGKKQSQKKTPPKARASSKANTPEPRVGDVINRRAFLNTVTGKDEPATRYKSMAEATKSSKVSLDPKQDARLKSQKAVKDWNDSNKQQKKEFNERTNHKYDVKYWEEKGDKKKAQEARIRVKSGENTSDIVAEELAVKYHPTAYSAARGAASGATFGASELAIKAQAKRDKERAKNEQYYQENKNKTAETVGELAGALASFGATAGATEKLGAKAASKVAPKAAERLAEKEFVKNAAKRSVNKAVKKGLVNEASEELIKQVGKDKAAKIVSALGTDIAQNLTTGAIYDINRASRDYEVGSKDWWKELGKSAALNFGVTGGIAGASALGGGKQLAVDAAETVANRARARRSLDDLIANNAVGGTRATGRTLPRVGESLEDRIARLDAERLGKSATENADELFAPNVGRNINDMIRAEDGTMLRSGEVLNATDEAAENLPRYSLNRRRRTDVVLPDERRAAEERIAKQNADDFAMVDDSIPVEDINQTRTNDARAEAEARAKRVMDEEPINEEASTMKGAAQQAEEAAEQETTEGVRQARQEWAKQRGEEFTKDGKAPDFDTKWEASMRYEKSQGTSAQRKLSRAAKSQFNAIDDEAQATILEDLIKNTDAMEYDVIHHKEMYEKAAKDLADDYERWVDKLNDIAEGGDWSGKEATDLLAKAQYISAVLDAGKDPESAALADVAFKVQKTLASSSGQTLNMRRQFVHLDEASKIDNMIDDLVAILDPSLGFNAKHRKAMQGLNKFEREHYIKGQLMSDPKIKECVKKVVNAKTEDAVSDAYTELLIEFNKHNPKAGFDVLQEIRYLNMLGNPKTHIRNVFGSAFFAPMRQVSNMIRSGIEDRIAKEAGLEVTKHGGLSLEAVREAWTKKPTTEAGKAAQEAFERMRKDILGSAKYDTVNYTGRGKTLVGKGLDKLSDFNSNLLAKEDDFFRQRAFKENYIKSYNRYIKDGKPITDKVKKQIEAEALAESQIATFNEYNEFAKFLNNIQRKASDANASTFARWGGRGVNAVMPFTKVPANLMKQSMNYSPIGIAKGMFNIKTAAKNGDAAMLNRAIDELSSGLTGSAVFGLGMLLGKTTDMFTTNTGKNDPAAKFKKDRGMQNYSITFKDPETGKGYSFTLDWLVPTSATFFSGVEMANQLKSGDFNALDIGNDWSAIVTRLAEPVMETSMLSGLHGMLETMRSGSNDDDTKSAIGILGRETVQSYLNSLIPTVAGQVARTKYKTDLQITGDTDWEYWKNSMKSKAGLGDTNIFGEELGADTDAYGNIKGEKNSASDYVKSGLKNFLSPANIQKVDFSEVDNEKLRVYEDAVKNGADPNDMAYLFPKKQYKKQFSVAGEDVKMSNKDLSTYNQAKTTGGEEGMRYILENIMFNRYDYDSKGKKVPTAEAYTKAEKQALMEQFKGKSMREVEEWLYQQPEFKNASKAEQKKAISGLWGLSKDTKTVASQRVGEQAVYKAQGKDVNEYNFKNEITESRRDQLQPYIDSGLLTYEEAVDFARNGGKVSYTEDEDGGGSATTYYSKAAMIDYFVEHGIPYDKAEALYNAFKAKNAKPYSGNNKSSGRRGYGGYRRGGGGSRKAKVPTIDAKSMAAATKKSKGTTVKLEPPKPKTTKVTTKFKKYEV